MTDAAASPVTDDEFDALTAPLGPFEAAPRIAVAVSGGIDSMALCLLAAAWAGRRGGDVVALTVDHGLRPDSAAEAAQVGRWLAARSLAHRILTWTAPKPAAGIQAAAREARYDLLAGYCRDAGILHLLIAHNLEDQAETLLLRLARGSGVDGLAAMAAVWEMPAARLLRPLLPVPRRRLRATLAALGQPWIEDPSNRDPAFERVRVRRYLPALGAAPLAATARRLGGVRMALEAAASALAARACAFHPAGFVRLDRAVLAAAAAEPVARVLARVLVCVGGLAYPPRRERLERLHAAIAEGGPSQSAAQARAESRGLARTLARTLGRCRIIADGRTILICRENRPAMEPVAVTAGSRLTWDSRFFVVIGGGDGSAWLRRLGRGGWAEIVADRPALRNSPLPAAARITLPALGDDRGVLQVPHLSYNRADGPQLGLVIERIVFRPPNSLSGLGFRLV